MHGDSRGPACEYCGAERHRPDDRRCSFCEARLPRRSPRAEQVAVGAIPPAEEDLRSEAGALSPAEVPNYLVHAILCTLCCCVPTGIVAIVYAAQVNGHLERGEYAAAQAASENAKLWCIISLVLGLLTVLLSSVTGETP